jgi:preprotein translocase subunit SecG
MFQFLLIVQVITCVSIIGLVMMQQGKGADMGAAFGSGAAGTVFGAGGGGSFLTRTTAALAVVFFVNCLLIASPLIRDNDSSADSIAEAIEQQQAEQAEKENAMVETVETIEVDVIEGDLPDVPDAPVTGTGSSDLPE